MTDAVTKIEAPVAPVEQRQGHMISMIERVAMSPEMPVEKLEQMLALQERIWEREARQAFNMAISLARAEIAPIIKTAEVDFTSQKGRTHYKHETLDGIARQIDPILAANGLSYRFRTAQDGGQVSVTCIIAHRDGYSEETTLSGPPDNSGNKNPYQAVGSAVTYLQRYTLKAALGLSAAKDDDAQSVGRDASTINEDQFREIRDLCERAKVSEELVCKAAGVETLFDLPAAQFESVKKKLMLTVQKVEGE